MSKNRKLLIGLSIIACFIFWYKCCKGGCNLYIGDDKCGYLPSYKQFKKEDWVYTYGRSGWDTRCMRELMICDLTQNVIPIGTPYEDVVALLGSDSSQYCMWPLPWTPGHIIRVSSHNSNPNLISEQKQLIYGVGSSASGPNSLAIVFENDRVVGFLRGESK